MPVVSECVPNAYPLESGPEPPRLFGVGWLPPNVPAAAGSGWELLACRPGLRAAFRGVAGPRLARSALAGDGWCRSDECGGRTATLPPYAIPVIHGGRCS